jgi:N-methylhydantoinase A/oxoprolinase/acetone carboxylase beta subunit
MEARGRALLAAAGADGAVIFTRSADMRYVQQGSEIRVSLSATRLGPDDLPAMQRTFTEEYQRLYKRLNPGVEIEVVNWRLLASGPRPHVSLPVPDTTGKSQAAARKGARPVYLPEHNDFVPCAVYDRYVLPPGATFSGPAVIEERECTVVVGPRGSVQVDDAQNLVVTLT